MNYTTNYKIQKPLITEKYDVNVYNTNADIIDSSLNKLDQKNAEQDVRLTNSIQANSDRITTLEEQYAEMDEMVQNDAVQMGNNSDSIRDLQTKVATLEANDETTATTISNINNTLESIESSVHTTADDVEALDNNFFNVLSVIGGKSVTGQTTLITEFSMLPSTLVGTIESNTGFSAVLNDKCDYLRFATLVSVKSAMGEGYFEFRWKLPHTGYKYVAVIPTINTSVYYGANTHVFCEVGIENLSQKQLITLRIPSSTTERKYYINVNVIAIHEGGI